MKRIISSVIVMSLLSISAPAYSYDTYSNSTTSYYYTKYSSRMGSTDSKTVPCVVYDYNSVDIVELSSIDRDKQLISHDELYKEFIRIPSEFRKNTKFLILLDYISPYSSSAIAACDSTNGNIFFYKNDETYISQIYKDNSTSLSVGDIHDMLEQYLVHEVAHSYDLNYIITKDPKWIDAVNKDTKLKNSDYKDASSVSPEEFSTACVSYVFNKEYIETFYPNKYKYLSNLFEKNKIEFSNYTSDNN